jgi:hypothetical protein
MFGDEATMPNDRDLVFAREAADRLLRRALIDDAFRERLKSTPDDVLKDAGLDPGASEDLLRELRVDGQRVMARSKMLEACERTCTNTCWITCLLTDPI